MRYLYIQPRHHFPYNLNYDIEQCNCYMSLSYGVVGRQSLVFSFSLLCSTLFIHTILFPLGSFYPIKFIRRNIWIWHQRHIVNRTIYIFVFLDVEASLFFVRSVYLQRWMLLHTLFRSFEDRVFPFELLMFAAIMSILYIFLVRALFCPMLGYNVTHLIK